MTRELLPPRRTVWRQKVRVTDADSGVANVFYVEFGHYPDGRLAELFVTGHKLGTFVRGVLDSLAQSVSLALQCGTSPLELAHTLRGQNYPPCGEVRADGSSVVRCTSIADYIGQEMEVCYGADGRMRAP